MPEKAEYFSNLSELIFDCSKTIQLFVPHILTHRERLPENLRDKDAAYIRTELNGALEITKKKIQANYKLAVPTLFEGKMGYFLPLYLGGDYDTASLALAVSDAGTHYEGKTCLTLELAYNDARVIAKLDTYWLSL